MVHNETSGEERLANDIEVNFCLQANVILLLPLITVSTSPVTLAEICFAGRSGVGKSSSTTLTGRRMLTRNIANARPHKTVDFFNLSVGFTGGFARLRLCVRPKDRH